MSDNCQENRVLTRMGARQLSENESNQVVGGLIPTRLTVIYTMAAVITALTHKQMYRVANPRHRFN